MEYIYNCSNSSSKYNSIDLDGSALDALVVTVKLNSTATETQLTRKSFEEYNVLPNKSQTGRPTQYAMKRNISNPTIFLYPVPNVSTGILNIEAIRQVEDINKSSAQNADAPVRFLTLFNCWS